MKLLVNSLISFTLLLSPLIVLAQTDSSVINELRNKIEDRNSQIKQLDEEIKGYQGQIREVGAQANTLQSAVKELDINQKKLTTEIKVTETNISKTNLNIEKLNLEIADSERQIGVNIAAVASSLRSIAYSENDSIIETVLANRNINELWNDIEQSQKVQTSLKDSTDTLRIRKADLEAKKSELQGERVQLVNAKSKLGDQKEIVEINKQEKNRLLTATKNQEAEYKRILEEKVKQREQFEQELFDFESQLKIAIDPSKIPASKSGVLDWPLQNVYITQLFGRTADSARLYVSGTHNGIDLRASRGTPILAARTGAVQAVGNTDAQRGCYSYGKWVLIEHDNGLSTMYAHLDLIKVSQGQVVQVGETIGYSGQTGYATGPHLHFTVYASEGVRVQQYVTSINCKQVTIPVADSKAYLDPMSYLPAI